MSSTDSFLRTLAHLAAIQTGSESAVLHHALYACMLAEQLDLSPAEADDRAAEPAWGDAERAVNERARALIQQARSAARAAACDEMTHDSRGAETFCHLPSGHDGDHENGLGCTWPRDDDEPVPAPAWTPNPGDTVTRTGTDGVWIVRGYEDDDFVWVYRPGTPMQPTYGRVGSGYTDLSPGKRAPVREELVAVVELRPAELAQDGAR